MRRFWFTCALLIIASIGVFVGVWGWKSWRVGAILPPPIPFRRFTRPYGMAPVAFKAFVQACNAAKVSPLRISQTLGNNPRSKGYHLQDGTIGGKPYSAAVDLGVNDLTPAKRGELLEALARCGFAAWYRSGPRWKNAEHVHAVYAGLPMKSQLQEQVRVWNRQQRQGGRKARRWQRMWRRFWR